jgi:formylglycine-generating enzyme required for sulfatase activity
MPSDMEDQIAHLEASSGFQLRDLAVLVGRDPSTYFRQRNIAYKDLSRQDLRGMDFSGADLLGCRFDEALIDGARFEQAYVDRRALRQARDWQSHVLSWRRPSTQRENFSPRSEVPFSDAPFAPELVAVPPGSLFSGDLRLNAPWAIGRFVVTIAEFSFYEMATGLRTDWEPNAWETPCPLSWGEAEAYCAWLSQATGVTVAVPSETLWEYAARAGAETRYYWGDSFDPSRANTRESGRACPSHFGEYPPNRWGLYDVLGNVREWTAGVRGSATVDDPSATEPRGAEERVVRGGSYAQPEAGARCSARAVLYSNESPPDVGLRVSRAL